MGPEILLLRAADLPDRRYRVKPAELRPGPLKVKSARAVTLAQPERALVLDIVVTDRAETVPQVESACDEHTDTDADDEE